MTDASGLEIELSFFEWRSQVAKAARGAGLPWGLAEEAGWAADWLVHGLPAARWVAEWLAPDATGPCPVTFGAILSDHCAGDPQANLPALPEGLRAPGLILPFLSRCTCAGTGIAIVAEAEVLAQVDSTGEAHAIALPIEAGQGWRLARLPDAGTGQHPISSRPTIPIALVNNLAALILRTMVPASETSRADAGSVMSDND